ncbi:hypothetical protein B0H13DRAFT_2534385 [Mycena leptocephala]|nr:hypothetical protein B0H13DRAFT_2534385 [Mycena leptocephala]
MSVKEPPANAKLPLDQDRLITAIQGCFRDLVKRQEEQFKSQEAQAERLQETIEALKPQGPVTDKKTTFWNSYMKLADEYDKEFQQKYITDLDSALIFAGLFSAVSSAFITEIQPQIIPPSQPKTLIVVSQTLLYISLFTTLLAALLAVLGKQWVMYYQSAGSRGTIEQRGLERQRKLAGLRRWKFDVVLQMFPLLLQLALLLFSTALSVYLWTIHRSIAVIVLVITFLGFGSYIFLLVSPIISADSPFQTPLAPFLIQLIASVLRILKFAALNVHTFGTQGWASVSGLVKSRTHILPRVVSDTSSSKSSYRTRKSLHGHHESRFFPPSLEGPAVLWVLETSTDPAMISVAAEMAIDLQWPLDLDLTVAMGRLEETFKSCFDIPSRRIRDATLARVENLEDLKELLYLETQSQDVQWIYMTLQHVQLVWERKTGDPGDPKLWDDDTILKVEAFNIILRALYGPGNTSFAAFLVLYQAKSWFLDPVLRPIMQASSVWSQLGCIALQVEYRGLAAGYYIEMRKNIEDVPKWKRVIDEDVSTWTTLMGYI